MITPLAYQREFVRDARRFILLLWSRQTGKSFSAALKVNDRVLAAEAAGRRSNWTLVAATKPRAQLLCAKVAEIGRAVCMARKLITPQIEDLGESQYRLTYPGGSTVYVAAAGSAAGYTGHLVFDEFDLVRRQSEVWGDAFPVASREGYTVTVITTPRGRRMAYTLWGDAQRPGGIWGASKLTIHDAVAQGCPQDPDELRAGLKNDLLWRQEYLCEFVDDDLCWLPWDLIIRSYDERCSTGFTGQIEEPVYWGWDVARWQHLSVLYGLQRVGPLLITRCVHRMRGLPFGEQLDQVGALLRRTPGFVRLCIDQTGMGEMVVEQARQRFGRVEGVKLTGPTKEVLAGDVRRLMEDGTLRTPDDDEVRGDLNSLRRTMTPAGNPRFEGEREGSHADIFWALAFAAHGAVGGQAPWMTLI